MSERGLVMFSFAALGVGLLALFIYGPVVSAPFVFDDYLNILNNGSVRFRELSLAQLREVSLVWPTPRPVSNLSFGLSYWWGGGYSVETFRSFNIALHILNALWVYALGVHLFRRLMGLEPAPARLAALLASLIFVAHPLQTQTVTYVVQRMNGLAAFFYLSSVACYAAARAVPWRSRRSVIGLMGCGACFVLAVGSKEHAVSLPAILWLYEWLLIRRAAPDFLRKSALPGLALGLLGSVIVFAVWDPFADYATKPFTATERVLTQWRVLWQYVGLILWPSPARLSLMHSVETSSGLLSPATTLLAAVGWAAVLFAAWRSRSARPMLCFGISWFLLALAVESSVLPLEMLFEHRTYLPMAGVAWMLGAFFAWVWQGGARLPAAALALCMVGALATAAQARNRVWLVSETLWRDAVEKSGHPSAHNNLGRVIEHQGRFDEAFGHYRIAAEKNPLLAVAQRNYGLALLRRGETENARVHLRAAVTLNPSDERALLELAQLALVDSDLRAAGSYLQRAFRAFPRARTADRMGLVAAQLGEREQARRFFEAARELAPQQPEPALHLGLAFVELGQPDAAERALESAIELGAGHAALVALADLAWSRGDLAQASDWLERAAGEAPPRTDEAAIAWRRAWLALATSRAPLAAARAQALAAPWLDSSLPAWRWFAALLQHLAAPQRGSRSLLEERTAVLRGANDPSLYAFAAAFVAELGEDAAFDRLGPPPLPRALRNTQP